MTIAAWTPVCVGQFGIGRDGWWCPGRGSGGGKNSLALGHRLEPIGDLVAEVTVAPIIMGLRDLDRNGRAGKDIRNGFCRRIGGDMALVAIAPIGMEHLVINPNRTRRWLGGGRTQTKTMPTKMPAIS